MTLIFLSLAVIIAIVVILVSAKVIKAGFDARSDVKDQIRNEDISEDDERRIGEVIQKATDDHINQIDEILKVKEKELMEI